ncbi:MAG: LacI family DNA-binding transcriptional regulator, partial [Ktedonobacteraceae bacterium]|nr:LacI family DNA-binding transcriptional regulator [Ktedonobacteraceae bacterium]
MAGKRTIDDIARLAGVSKTTVSRVLNRKPDVDPETRERILRIVEEEGFIPRVTASALATRRHSMIGVIIPSFTWPFIPEIIKGVAEVLGNTPHDIVLYSLNDSTRDTGEGDLIDHILDTRLTAGILAILPGQFVKHALRLHQHGIPMVMIDDQEIFPTIPWIGIDNKGGALTAMRHLIQLGHQRIAHLQGPMRYLCSRERYEGYRQAMEEAGLPICPELVLEGDFTQTGGRLLANRLFSLPDEQRPTAIFAGNDSMAYGVMAAAEEYNLHMPEDIALVGFDDLALSAHVRPALTTVRQPFLEMGRRGIELLLSLLGSEGFSSYTIPATYFNNALGAPAGVNERIISTDPLRIQLVTSFVVRASCGSS